MTDTQKIGLEAVLGMDTFSAAVNAYNAALKQRGSLQIWFDPETVWLAEPSGRRGRSATFTDAAIRALAAEKENLVFMLWGNYAQQKGAFIDSTKHLVLKSVHPSPLSAYRGFIGNNHFALANNYLKEHGKREIEW